MMNPSHTIAEKSFNTGEVTLNYAEVPASGAPLVMLHGGLRWWQDWQEVMPELAVNWHLYALDLRGHGKSGRDADHYRLPDFTRDVVAFLRDQVGEPVLLMGQSLGALAAIGTAALAPELVRAQILLDPPIFLRSEPITLLTEYHDWFVFVHGLLQTHPTYAELTDKVSAIFPDGSADRVKIMVDSLYGLDPEMIAVMLRGQLFEGFNVEQALEPMTCPTLIMQADWDAGGAMRDSDADFVRAHLPSATIHKFPGFSHLLLQEHPDIVLQETQKFLQTV